MRFDSTRGLLWHIEQLLEKSFEPDFPASKFSAGAGSYPSIIAAFTKKSTKPTLKTLISQLT